MPILWKARSQRKMIEDESEKLLDDSTLSLPKQAAEWQEYTRARTSQQRLILTVSTSLFVLTNAFWLLLLFGINRNLPAPTDTTAAYYGSPSVTPVAFDHDWVGLLDSESGGQRYREEEWHALFPHHGGVVALSRDYARQHNLAPAALTPEDPDKMIYMVAGYHQLHCAGVVRDAVYYLNGTLEWPDQSGFIWDHVLHCIEAVRQALACALDDTLIPLSELWPGIPNGQQHVCRNKDALRIWVDEHGHPLPVDPHVPSATVHGH